jgi:alkanesulfonate monooxygenase
MLEFHWCAPLNGDGYKVGLPVPERPTDYNYIRQIFGQAERYGFCSLLIGVGFTHHILEGWTLASALLPQFGQIGAMIAIRPGLYDAPLFAKMATTLDGISAGRVRLNIVTGGRPTEEAMYGDFTNHDARYRRTAEFIEICRLLWSSLTPFDYKGEFYDLRGCVLETLPAQPGGPPLYFGGASVAAQQVCARHADIYMMWGEPVELIKERIAVLGQIEASARDKNRPPLRFGLRINLFARSTEQEAVAAAFNAISGINPKVVDEARQAARTSGGGLAPNGDLRFNADVAKESVGQDRQWALRSQADENWWVRPGLWAGLSLVRRGAGMALVGSYRQVADYLLQYVEAGVTVFILSGLPHLEEAENIGKNVLPLVREGYMKHNPLFQPRKS